MTWRNRGEVRILGLNDVAEYVVCSRDCDADSGSKGQHYHPYSKDQPYDVVALTERNRLRFFKPLNEPEWRRAWAWICNEDMVGVATLTAGPLETNLHRAGLGMGLLPAFRGMGGGSRLLQAVIDWARIQPQLSWIDLGVFADNPPAYALYKKFGFVENGRTPDLFRVDGAVLDNISMALSVETASTGS